MSVPDYLLDPPDDAHCPVCEGCDFQCDEPSEHERCSIHDDSDFPEE